MVSATQLAQEGYTWLGTPYSVMDCQAFVEKCLRGCGCAVDLSGSNAWYRKMTWTGTPEECREAFGCVPAGAFLFIWKDDGKEPAKYRGDGKGNASHIGLKTGRSPGAIHSSESVGRVAESNFRDKSIRGGWNRVGLWTEVRYGEPIDSRLRGGSGMAPGGETSPPEMGLSQPVRVYAENGLPVKLRQSFNPRSKAYRIWEKIPSGTAGLRLRRREGWSWCQFGGKTGWMMEEFVKDDETNTEVKS